MSFQEIKLALMAGTGLSRDALHIYAGLVVLFVTAAVLRKPLRSWLPWTAVLVAAVVAELFDLCHTLRSAVPLQWRASLHDLVNTLFWPSVLLLMARARVLVGR